MPRPIFPEMTTTIAYLKSGWLRMGAWIGFTVTALGAAAAPESSSAAVPGSLDFNRDIRPILSEHCYACHGPDENKRKAGLRLDRQEDAFKELKEGRRALVAGDLEHSTLAVRIASSDPDEIMPPPKFGKPLSPAEAALLRRWVSEGAAWKKHWAFLPPEHLPVPGVTNTPWVRNEVDHFILSRIEKEDIQPDLEADRATLIRRVTLDLTGLPPTIAEVDQFLADTRKDAYEQLVDRLLASPHYGERMAMNWLDLSRFADTSGYHFDGVRFMWLWRDWVIRAFNDNKPYDAFTVEQLAGDLLPNATPEQRLATGFVRNNMTNDEGGADPDEYLNKYVVDRVNTVGAVWLGLTVGCTECHDHKYDPLTTREFYRMYAFFHNVPEKGLDRIRTDNPPPRLPMPTPEQARAFVEAEFTLKDAEKTLQDRINELGETQEKWERELPTTRKEAPLEPAQVRIPLTDRLDPVLSSRQDTPTSPTSETVAAIQPEWQGAEHAEFVDGLPGRGLSLKGKTAVAYGSLVSWDATNAVSFGGWIQRRGDGAVLSKMDKGPGYRGFDLLIGEGRAQVHLIHQWPDQALKVKTREVVPDNRWVHLWVTYDGRNAADGLKVYVDGKLREVEVERNQLSGTLTNTEPLRIGSRSGESYFNGDVADLRFYARVTPPEEVGRLVLEGYQPLLAKSRGHRTDAERNQLAEFYKANYAVDYLRAEKALSQARQRKEALMGQIPTSLVMEEMDPPRDTHVLVRGDFRTKGERVTAGTPAVLPPLPDGPVNRLTLARWLVATNHPLTARVTVNRYWGMVFGTGLVKTANDFGSQGEWPSHPELLDWLAARFRDGGPASAYSPALRPWDVKGLMRLLVTSATYRQSARVDPAKLERDPYNRLLARSPRLRLDAEFIRDNALAVSGLLNDRVGGPSVKPYQPPGIWDGTDSVFVQDHGDLLYRRGLYVFWRRSAHYPPFATFDAPNREVCTFLRQRTQTPLQSLVLMNDPAFVEAARSLAQRVVREEPAEGDRRLVRAFRHTLGRMPEPDEIGVLKRAYDQQLAEFQSKPESAHALLKVGESGATEGAPPAELAAMTAVANVLLNLNETITR